MTRLRIALLNAAHEGADTRRNFRRELDADLVEFDVTDGHIPDHTEYDGVVVTGSRSSVYWEDEWIPPLVEYVGEAAAANVPVLGVCFGHQVLAEALGGHVVGMDEFEIGYTTVRHHGDELFTDVDEEFTVFVTHGDTVSELPPKATLLAENEYGVHAFRREHVWGVQFHPEYDIETAQRIADGKRSRIGDGRVDDALSTITDEAYADACEVKSVFDNFVTYARDRKTADRSKNAVADD